MFDLKLIISLLAVVLFADKPQACVNEMSLGHGELYSTKNENSSLRYYVRQGDRYIALQELSQKSFNQQSRFEIQAIPEVSYKGYDDRYLPYYTYDKVQKYLDRTSSSFDRFGYQVKVVGQSLEGRNLYGVWPKSINPNKKIIVMFSRHHGDEGTANWITEGFIDQVFKFGGGDFFKHYQLFYYPMVNPDGAEARVRYNSNGRDLNREWQAHGSLGRDEISLIHRHLKTLLAENDNVHMVLDMHGSFTQDFIYRVDRNFSGQSFYNLQGRFIEQLGALDPWQKGTYKLSNGHPQMSRIVMITHYNYNALTHETPRNIPLNSGRDLNDLKEQGRAIYDVLLDQAVL